VPVARLEQQTRKRHALARRPQAGDAQALGNIKVHNRTSHCTINIWGSARACNAMDWKKRREK